MQYKTPLLPGTLIRRYKRFLVDVAVDGNDCLTVHCPNSGSMLGCSTPGWQVLLSTSSNTSRKYPCTLELVHNGVCWICVNTHIPNLVSAEAVASGTIPELRGYDRLRREVKYGENSRIDLLLEGRDRPCYVEVKNVTLVDNQGAYCFPDAVTTRGLKHLRELQNEVRKGNRAVMLYVIQRSDGTVFRPAEKIDPAYAAALRQACSTGVEVLAYRTRIDPPVIEISERVDVDLN